MTAARLSRPAAAASRTGAVGRVDRSTIARRLWRHGGGRLGILLLLLVIVAIGIGPLLLGDPNATDYGDKLAAPSWEHPLGTDLAGRDMLARTLVGGRLSLGIAGLVSLTTLLTGLVLGLVAGLAGGWVDKVLSRVFDVLLGLPTLVVALAVVGALGPGLVNLVLALTVIGWAFLARLARNEVLGARHRPDVVAARMAGVPAYRIAWSHVVPNVVLVLLVAVTAAFTEVVLALAGLSFLGLGAQPPTAEWGRMLAETRSSLTIAPWLVLGPGVGLCLSIAGMLLLSDALRDVADPTRHRRQ
ncbi:ABC transporter permease [Nocardioides sp. L-11A]|uniref:ABC transporter permease n=1 Tax=Nocardioides sp. L-11A TaxID=3043848 RepID=UPI00249A63ED|nr:ABC transporter permease [Nocardioides sp. L-11A]